MPPRRPSVHDLHSLQPKLLGSDVVRHAAGDSFVPCSNCKLMRCEPFRMLIEDATGSDTDEFGVCRVAGGDAGERATFVTLVLSDVVRKLRDGDNATLEVIDDAASDDGKSLSVLRIVESRPAQRVHADQWVWQHPHPHPKDLSQQQGSHILRQAEHRREQHHGRITSQAAAAVGTSALGPHVYLDLIALRLAFTDAEPAYCDEACVVGGLYDAHGTDPSVDTLFLTSTYGRVSLQPREKTQVLTVRMGTRVADQHGCPYLMLAEQATQLAMVQHGVDATAYSFREYFLPANFPGCRDWQGLATVGCGFIDALPSPGACEIWYRDGRPFVRGQSSPSLQPLPPSPTPIPSFTTNYHHTNSHTERESPSSTRPHTQIHPPLSSPPHLLNLAALSLPSPPLLLTLAHSARARPQPWTHACWRARQWQWGLARMYAAAARLAPAAQRVATRS